MRHLDIRYDGKELGLPADISGFLIGWRGQGCQRDHDRCLIWKPGGAYSSRNSVDRRASYGEELVARLAKDLSAGLRREFSRTNVFSDEAVSLTGIIGWF